MTAQAVKRKGGRPPSGSARVKFFLRAEPDDVATFRAAAAALAASERRRLTDGEVFGRAVAALVQSLPASARKLVTG